jgi:hypothetical protein
MFEFLRDILSSDILVFGAMFAVFVYLSRQALMSREYTGYGLGWLIGLFFIVVYSATLPDQPFNTNLTESVRLSFFQVLLPTVCGIVIGIGLLILVGLAQHAPRQFTLLTAVVTAVNITLIFVLFVSESDARRQIGIFALAFAISAIVTSVIAGGGGSNQIGAQSADPQQPHTTMNRIEQMRERFRRQ